MIALIAVFSIVAVNFIIFDYLECRGEYIESRDYRGEVQSVSKKSLNTQIQLLEILPDDYDEAKQHIEKMKKLRSVSNLERLNDENRELYEIVQLSQAEKEDYDAVLRLLSAHESFKERNRRLEKADALTEISIFTDEDYENRVIRTVRDFAGVNGLNCSVFPDNGLNAWMNYRITDILAAVLAVVLAVCFSFYNLSSLERNRIRKSYAAGVGIAFLITGSLLMYATNTLLTFSKICDYDCSIWAQSLPKFYYCSMPIKLGIFMFWDIMMKVLGVILFYTVITTGIHLRGKKRLIYTAVAVVFVGLEAIAAFAAESPVEGSVLYLLQEINVFSLFTFERFFISYGNLMMFGGYIPRPGFFMGFVTVLSLVLFIMCIMTVRKLREHMYEELQYSYYQDIEQKYTETRQLWHDFHNHLLAIQELVRRGEMNEANSYLSQLGKEIDDTHLLTRSGSEALNVLIYQKSEEAGLAGIKLTVHIDTVIRENEFKDVAVCCVVGNLLDNAIEALERKPELSREIRLDISRRGEMLYICVDNEFSGTLEYEDDTSRNTASSHEANGIQTVSKRNAGEAGAASSREDASTPGKLRSSKTDKHAHGIGLSGVKRVCERYNGGIRIDTAGGHFKVQALMMAHSEKS